MELKEAYEGLYLALISTGKHLASQVGLSRYTEYRLGLFPGYGVLSALEERGLIRESGEFGNLYATDKGMTLVQNLDFDKIKMAIADQTEKTETLFDVVEKLKSYQKRIKS